MNNSISNTPSPNQLANLDQLDATENTEAAQAIGKKIAARPGHVGDISDNIISKFPNQPELGAPNGTDIKNISGLLSKLPSSQDSASTDMFAVMALMHKISTENRMADREDRLNRMDEMVSAMESKVENLRKAANKAFGAAVIQGAVQIGASVIQMAASNMSMKSATGSGNASKQATKLDNQAAARMKLSKEWAAKNADNPGFIQAKYNMQESGIQLAKSTKLTQEAKPLHNLAAALSAKAQSYVQVGTGIAGAANALGTIGSAAQTRESELAKADSEADQAHSDISRQQMDNLREAEQGWRDLMKDLRSQLEQLIQQDTQTKRNILQI